jgi:hypothetical protein
MTHMGLLRVLGVAVIAFAFGVTSAAQTGDPLAAIQAQLSSGLKVTRITADRTDIVTAGDVVQLHKPGLVMYAVASPLPPANSYKNGKIGQGWGGFGKDLVIGMATPGSGTAADYPHRQFVAEEKCFVTGIQVQKDGVLFQLYSDPYDDTRYYANLKIPFPDKKTVPPVDAEMRLVAEVLTVVPQESQSEQPTNPPTDATQDGQHPAIAGQYFAPSGSHLLLLPDGSFTKFVGSGQGHGQYVVDGDNLTLTFTATGFSQHFKIQGGNLLDVNTHQQWARTGDAPGSAPAPPADSAAAPAPLPNITPPPPPTDTPPPTVAVGQTKDQVTAILGQPVKAAKIGTKEIFYYKDMKVTFSNGKVSNVE